MAIKGLTDRELAFPEIGHIRKGRIEKTTNQHGREVSIPKDLTYFRVDFDESEFEAAATFHSLYGPEPREITVVLPFNDIPKMWDPFLEAYTAGRMLARSDGETVLFQVDPQTGDVAVMNGRAVKTGQPVPHPTDNVAGYDYQNKPVKFKPTGRLKVVIPQLARAAYVTVHTTSYHDIVNLTSQLRALQTLNGGQIAGIPMILRRRPKKISTPDKDGKRVRREKWLLSIEADPEWVKAKLAQIHQDALPGNGFRAELPEPQEEPEMPAEWEDEEEGDFTESPTPAEFQTGEFDYYQTDPDAPPVKATLAEAVAEAIPGAVVTETVDEPAPAPAPAPKIPANPDRWTAEPWEPETAENPTPPPASINTPSGPTEKLESVFVAQRIFPTEADANEVIRKLSLRKLEVPEAVRRARGYQGWRDMGASADQAAKMIAQGKWPA